MLRNPRFALAFVGLVALAGVLTQPVRASATEAAKLHVLIVGDTLGQGAHQFGFDLDIANVRRVVEESMKAQNMGDRYTIQTLQGPDVTRARVLGYYKNLKASPNDVLLFYYTGHGAIDTKRGHHFELRDGRLYKTELLQAINRHNPRLAVLLNDCCSTVVGVGQLSPNAKYASLPGAVKSDQAVTKEPAPAFKTTGSAFRDLFFRHTGLVDIMAAATGQGASGNRKLGGSFFTVALATLLSKEGARFDLDGNGFVEWNEFFTQLRQETVSVSKSGGQPHTPQAVNLGQSAPGGTAVVQNPPRETERPQPQPKPKERPLTLEELRKLPAEGH
jgi:hypothetical protein